MPTKQTRPFPDAVSGVSWRVADARTVHARTMVGDRLQAVPYSTEPCQCGEDHARTVRLRELVQAKRPGVLVGEEWAVTAAEHARGWALVETLPTTHGLATGPMKCPGTIPGWLEGFMESMAEAGASEETMGQMAVSLAFGLSPAERLEVPGEVGQLLASAPEVNIDDGTYGIDTAQQLVNWLVSKSPPPPFVGNRMPEDEKGDGSGWAKMDFEEPRLTIPTGAKVRKRRTAEEGDVIRDIMRLYIDGRVFKARTAKPPAGSMLVDTSGSMDWTYEHLREVILQSPAALVAAYSGTGHRGTLRVVARRGMRTDDVSTPGGSNSVDGPALRWLGQQKGPRVWFSDGGANSSGLDHYEARADCERICKAHNITRTMDLSEAIRLISGRR